MIFFNIVIIICWAAWLRKRHPNWISIAGLIIDIVTVAVAFVPEGLPIALTASLTIMANIMKRSQVLCKSLKTVETLGAVSVICSDKTGTLTGVLFCFKFASYVLIADLLSRTKCLLRSALLLRRR